MLGPRQVALLQRFGFDGPAQADPDALLLQIANRRRPWSPGITLTWRIVTPLHRPWPVRAVLEVASVVMSLAGPQSVSPADNRSTRAGRLVILDATESALTTQLRRHAGQLTGPEALRLLRTMDH